ncbi:MAG: pectin acetylesterase-family hydrolase [Myxococcota bacterium]
MLNRLALFPMALLLTSCGDDTNSSDASFASDGTALGDMSEDGAAEDAASDATAPPADAASDALPGADAGDAAVVDPIGAPLREWSWVPIDGAICANGAPTGVAINLSDASDNVMIYFEGGGACWDFESCYEEELASFIESGFSGDDFDVDLGLDDGLTNRERADNPVRDWSWVYVPYCTGDVHAGNRTAVYNGRTTEHRGHRNFQLALARIVATRPSATRVLMTGSSAGGYGASFNLATARTAYPSARIDLISDGGPLLAAPALRESRRDEWLAAWGREVFDQCAGCADDWSRIYSAAAAADPTARVALLSWSVDPVIAFYFDSEESEFASGLESAQRDHFDTNRNAALFAVRGEGHTMFGQFESTVAGGTNALRWIYQVLNDDPSWTSVTP